MNHFFAQPPNRRSGGSATTSEADMSSMDDVQFSASLDALLNGEQMAPSCNNNNMNNNGQQQQAGPYLVVTGVAPPAAAAAAAAAQGQPMQQPQQQQQQTSSSTQQQQMPPGSIPTPLAGLPLASANQGALTLQPPGPHSAAQLSLSVGHAAATGGFHPTGLATSQLQFPAWTPAPAAASLPPPPQPQQPMAPLAAASNNAAVAAVDPSCMMPMNTKQPTRGRSNNSSSSSSFHMQMVGSKRARSSACSVSAVSEDEGERERRRAERNLREQQRSHKITEQITHLREVLSTANIQFKPDKYSTLTKVVDYIKQLQERSTVLDGEHRKLLETISKTNEIVNNQYVPAYASGADPPRNSDDMLGNGASPSSSNNNGGRHHHHRHHSSQHEHDDSSLSHIRGIDYKIVFMGCGIPQALASIDGRFLDCNSAFLELTGYCRQELLPLEPDTAVSFSPPPPTNDNNSNQKKNLSLFNLLSRDGMELVFVAMSDMLKHPGVEGANNNSKNGSNSSNSGSNNSSSISMESTDDQKQQPLNDSIDEPKELVDFWSGPVKLGRQQDLPVKLNVTLVRTSRGRPKFFNCALTAIDDCTTDGAGRGDDSTLNSVQSLNSTTQEQVAPNPEDATIPPPLPTDHQEND